MKRFIKKIIQLVYVKIVFGRDLCIESGISLMTICNLRMLSLKQVEVMQEIKVKVLQVQQPKAGNYSKKESNSVSSIKYENIVYFLIDHAA